MQAESDAAEGRSQEIRQSQNRIVCRSNGAGYGVSAIFLMYGAGLVAMTRLGGKHQEALPLWVSLCCGIVFLAAAALAVYWERIVHITADAEGLVWRTLAGQRRARWSEVTDYYDSFVRLSQTKGNAVIETTSGSLRLNGNWRNEKELREAIPRCAANARATEWEVIGTRRCDQWPRTFAYASGKRKYKPLVTGLLGLAYLLILGVQQWNYMAQTFGILGIRVTVLMFFLSSLLTMLPGASLLLSSFQTAKILRSYGRDSLQVTIQGFTFTSGTRRVSAQWSEIGDYYTTIRDRGAEYVLSLRGADEILIKWSGQISDSGLLAHIVQKYAPHPEAEIEAGSDTSWRRVSANMAGGGTIDPAAARFTAYGGKTFMYRNDMNRPLLLGMTFIMGGISLLPSLYLFLELDMDNKNAGVDFAAILIPMAIALGYSWWRYFAAGIEIDDFWITQRTPAGRRRIAWIAIRDYKDSADPCLVYGQKGMPIAFYATISQLRELKAEIERRAPTPQTGWTKKLKTEEPG